MKAKTLLAATFIAILVLACSGEKKAEARRLAEIGRKQWAEDYHGSERTPTDEEAISAAKRAVSYEDMRAIVSAQVVFYEENGRYAQSLSELNISPKSEIYTYSMTFPTAQRLRVIATGKLDEDDFRDVIVMNQLGDVEIIEDDIRNWKQTDGLRRPARIIQQARDAEKKIDVGTRRRLQELDE